MAYRIESMETEFDFVQRIMSTRTRTQWKADAKASKVPFSTFKKIGYKQVQTSRSDTVGKIAAYYREVLGAERLPTAPKRGGRALAGALS